VALVANTLIVSISEKLGEPTCCDVSFNGTLYKYHPLSSCAAINLLLNPFGAAGFGVVSIGTAYR
jgi:hypothetical protein